MNFFDQHYWMQILLFFHFYRTKMVSIVSYSQEIIYNLI